MTDRFSEYLAVSTATPLRQGDILESVDPEMEQWKRHLLVMTADCDFAFAKHQGRVTCVPLLSAEEYLFELQIPRVRERLAKKPMKMIRDVLRNRESPQISDQRLREWASEESSTDIVKNLELPPNDADTAAAALNSIKLMDEPISTLKQSVEMLITAQLTHTPELKRATAKKQVIEPLQSTYTRPPGDALFISTIADGHTSGYFAYLRHIEQVREPDISLGTPRRSYSYRRISRMTDKFTHALAQRFAMVFMSIGLPTQYEDMRDLYSETLGEEFS